MRATEFIIESFNSNVSGQVVRATSDLYTTKATIGGRTIVFNSSQYDNDEGKSVWEIDFTEYEKKGTGTTYKKTGSGSGLQVFSFVVQSIKELIAIYHPDQLTFTSHKADDNRTKLYQRMVSRIKVPGYHAAPVDSGEYDDYFKIVKDNLSEEDDLISLKLNNNNTAKEWIQKVYEMYPQTWQNNHVMPMGGSGEDQQFAMFELTPSLSKRNAAEVKWFQAFPLRQGVGGRAMRVLQDLAKKDGIGLTLFPWQHGQVSQAKLMKFYKGAGFKPTAKGAKSMAWDPSINEIAEDTKDVMRATEFITEVTIDNVKGAGAVPYNQDIDYFGLRVKMKPSIFLKLALPLGQPHSAELEKYIADGGAIGSPFLEIKIPPEWDDSDFSKFAQVAGHEGRNRITAIKKLEGDEPIEVHLIPRGGLRARDLTAEFVEKMQEGMYAERSTHLVSGPLFVSGSTSINESKTTINKLYAGNFPEHDESFWDEVQSDECK
jgi:hypothetical protein